MPSTIPSTCAVDHSSLLSIERTRLLDVLGRLGSDDWTRPTPCPGWSVLDLATHLLGDDLGFLAGHRDGHLGIPAPDVADENGFIDWLDQLQDGWVGAARRLSPRLVVDLLAWCGPRLVDTVAAEDPAERVASVSWASADPVPRWLDHARELSERWIHRQQLLDALERPPDLRPDLVDPVLDGMRWAYPFRLAPHRRPPHSVVDIDVVGPAGRDRWRLVSDGEAWAFAEPGTAIDVSTPIASLTMSTDQTWRLLSNNLDIVRHGLPGRSGEPSLVETLLATRAIIGRPRAPG